MNVLRKLCLFVLTTIFSVPVFGQQCHIGSSSAGSELLPKVTLTQVRQTQGVSIDIAPPVAGSLEICLVTKEGVSQTLCTLNTFSSVKTYLCSIGSGKAGDTVKAQLVTGGGKAGLPAEQTLTEACTDVSDGTNKAPSFSLKKVDGKYAADVIANWVQTDAPETQVLMCKNGEVIPDVVETRNHNDGKFHWDKLEFNKNDKIQVEIRSPDGRPIRSSKSQLISEDQKPGFDLALVGGWEQSGFSSLATNGEAFLSAFLNYDFLLPERFDRVHLRPWSFWGQVRLLGVPTQTTNGVGSVLSDPSGTVKNTKFDTVGQSADYVLGLQKYLTGESDTFGRLGLIGYVGASTPFPSSDVLGFKVPDFGTPECAELIKRFPTDIHGDPLSPGFSKTTGCLLAHDGSNTLDGNGKPVATTSTSLTTIAFANSDRSGFFPKWGVGVRVKGTQNCNIGRAECADAFGQLDVTLGQDGAISGGKARTPIFKVDGLLPIKTGDASYFYFFGSAYKRLTPNVAQTPLLLAPSDAKPTVPALNTLVLAFQQPDRDFYRLGIGLNLVQIFCKINSAVCSNGQ